MPVSTGKLRFSISSIAIEAAIEGRGFVLAQLSMVWDDIKAGRLVAPFNRPLPLPQPYILAWDDAILKKPFAGAMHHWLVEMGREQTMRRDLLPSLSPPVA
jgi:LysR family glycine cleavage system transcriptional activator